MKNKTTVNFIYALAIFFYIDLTVALAIWIGNEHKERTEIRQQANDILNTPDLTQTNQSLIATK
jgi:hypothetical protein